MGTAGIMRMKYPRCFVVSGAFALVFFAGRHVDGQKAGLLLRGPEQTQFVPRAAEGFYVNTVSSSSTNFVVALDAPTGW